jgi:hypothetical protein
MVNVPAYSVCWEVTGRARLAERTRARVRRGALPDRSLELWRAFASCFGRAQYAERFGLCLLEAALDAMNR